MQQYKDLGVSKETSVRPAFLDLLKEVAKKADWIQIQEHAKKNAQGRTIYPDSTFVKNGLPRGYYEAKDSGDKLDVEIRKKADKGYPLSNIIFEDTQTAVLYQNRKEAFRTPLSNRDELARLLSDFLSYTEPVLEDFDAALANFKDRVPELAKGLVRIIEEAHKKNKKFQAAFASFHELCKTALNPNISTAAVDEMLVQHVLTERLIRKIFDNPNFTRRNVIAAEIEKVIDALVSQSFDRDEYLRSLDSFYTAIETAGHGLGFTEKQGLLNTVYERFFQGYSIKIADTHGIVYTPQPIVDFMCASVAEVLQTEFGKSLGDDGVVILDPATGTGNFIVNLLRRVPKQHLETMYKERLFANEIMLLPYYIAALNIEHAYYELTGNYEPFEGLCFVDTLDLAEGAQMRFSFMTEQNTARVERQKKAPITVIIGNPPYNVGQESENDNNKNRKYDIIDQRIKDTYAKDSQATLKTQLYDPYVKFFRWAIDRLQGRDGIVCMVTNNSFVDQISFDGMRKNLIQDFTRIYHIDLHGNVRQNPKLSGTTHNVFGIQVGVGITVAVKLQSHAEHCLYYQRVEENLRKEEKYSWLAQHEQVGKVHWQILIPDSRHTWRVPRNADTFARFLPIGDKDAKSSRGNTTQAIFKLYSGGVKTNRDDVVYDFNHDVLSERMGQFAEAYNAEVDRFKRNKAPVNIDGFVDHSRLKWDGTLKGHLKDQKYGDFDQEKMRISLYRPFTKQRLYFDRLFINSIYLQHYFFPTLTSELENHAISLTAIGSEKPFMSMITNSITDLHLVGAGAQSQCFPFYTYDEDGNNRRENITDWALNQFRTHYADPSITKWDIFYYVYGILHHPEYRTKFADNLKRELPRIPFALEFRAFADAGHKLADLHLNYEQKTPYKLEWRTAKDTPLSYRVEKMRLSKDKTQLIVNDSLTLSNIPPDTFNYRLGNRSALDWVIDQYQVSTDKRSGITSDPNRDDDERYIVDLVGRVITVSLETVNIVASLPAQFST
ncbi:MAG: N-6 DNA methylase [Anaerolineae bacterium]|nr:N-6 DNA methylase [Anaerolineae bacterium]